MQTAARRIADGEIVELKATVADLRERLEQVAAERDAIAQCVRSEAEAEILQLRETAGSLRAALEAAAVLV